MALRYRPGRIIIPATKDRFTNNLPDLSQLLCVPINTDELDTITSNMGTTFSNTIETVAPIKLKKVREKRAAPWYNSYTHSLKKETRILERKWRKTNLEVNGRLPAAARASVITAFKRCSDALISRVVLVSRNVKTAHSRYYKDLREIIFHLHTASVMMLFTSVSEKQRTNISTDRLGMAPK